MSHQEKINYEQVAIKCESICEVAENRLHELDDMLNQIEKTSTKLINSELLNLAKSIRRERDSLLNEMTQVREAAQSYANQVRGYDTNSYLNIDKANQLLARVNQLDSSDLVHYKNLINNLLNDRLLDSYKRVVEGSGYVVTIDTDTQIFLDSIEDETLRHYVYIAFLNNNKLSKNELLDEGKHLMNNTYESKLEEEKNRIRAELEASHLDNKTIDNIMSKGEGEAKEQIEKIREAATQEIVDEKIRKKSLKIIMQAIEKRGFIVDKRNIKIQRDTNEVVMIAQKASGEKAEFRVFLDGKFIYDFHGYQGQACQKDIAPFLNDLEEVYGMHIKSREEIWSNPDKISTMKYQAFNTNKNKG